MAKCNERDLEWEEYDQGEVAMRRKELANAVDAEKLGCSLYELEAGNRSWPYHYHTANEEALFVLHGTGMVRLDGEERDLEVGDFVVFPADETGAHQVVNDGDEPLRYLVVSTMNEPDVTIYPEMGKLGVFVGSAPGGREERSLHGYYPIDADVDYWDDK
ncbi:cupin domain-containing protein [Natrialbaceae archaeon A-gly3]